MRRHQIDGSGVLNNAASSDLKPSERLSLLSPVKYFGIARRKWLRQNGKTLKQTQKELDCAEDRQ